LGDCVHRITDSVKAKETVERAINSIAWKFQRIRHSQSVHNKIVDFKMLDFGSTDDETPHRDGAQCKRANCQRTQRERSNTLRSDCQCGDAHWRELIWFYLVHVGQIVCKLNPRYSILRPDTVGWSHDFGVIESGNSDSGFLSIGFGL